MLYDISQRRLSAGDSTIRDTTVGDINRALREGYSLGVYTRSHTLPRGMWVSGPEKHVTSHGAWVRTREKHVIAREPIERVHAFIGDVHCFIPGNRTTWCLDGTPL